MPSFCFTPEVEMEQCLQQTANQYPRAESGTFWMQVAQRRAVAIWAAEYQLLKLRLAGED